MNLTLFKYSLQISVFGKMGVMHSHENTVKNEIW